VSNGWWKYKVGAASLAVAALSTVAFPSGAVAQYSLTAPSGLVIEFDADRLLDMRNRSRALREDLEQDPRILYYTTYGEALAPADSDDAYPWNAVEIATDSSAAVFTPGNLREADRAYYNYIVHRMHAVREDPDVSCEEIVLREVEGLDAFADGWVVARTLFGGPAFEPLDEIAFVREEGLLPGFLAAHSDRQLGGCLTTWRDAHPEVVEAYRAWRRDRYAVKGE